MQAALTCEPELVHVPLEPDDEFLVLASDGLWDKLQNGDVVRIARNHLQHHNNPEACARRLVEEALARGADDNISVILVCFKEQITMRRSNSVLSLRCRG
jgi:protein phosphatase PTC2/3